MHNLKTIYLDNAATTMLSAEVADGLAKSYHQAWGNPASQHRDGRHAQATLEDAKDRIKACCLGSQSHGPMQAWQLVITSGGTEANNLAIRGLRATPMTSLVVSAVEHTSVLALATDAQGDAANSHVVEVGEQGQVNIDALERLLSGLQCGTLVSVMLGNNETGIVQSLEPIAAVCRRYGAMLHCDVVQAFGKVPVSDFVPWVDAFTITAHKLHGPIGVGALMVRAATPLRPLLLGGGQQLGLRPGSESVPLVLAMAEACEQAESERAGGAMVRVAELRDAFETNLLALGLDCEVIGRNTSRLPHIALLAFPGLDRQALLMAFDMAGIACSSGSACASGSSQPSHVLTAMRLPPLWVNGAIRFSFSRFSSYDQVELAVQRVAEVARKMRKRS